VRFSETFIVEAAPEAVFDYMTNPENVRRWQTSKTSVQQLSDGPPGLGTRVRERTKPPGLKEFEQVVEFTEFERPRRLRVHVVEGPRPIDGTWSLQPDGARTRVVFVAEGELRGPTRLMAPIVRRVMARQFAAYHRNLRANLENV
jgi:uncharacterized protein YndB with AHSA1/START domain